MRIEYNFELGDCEIPCFSVEATEGPHKLFQLSTLVLNMLDEKDRVDVVFHSPNRGDLPRKVEAEFIRDRDSEVAQKLESMEKDVKDLQAKMRVQMALMEDTRSCLRRLLKG